jgi:hypothetical protein
VKVETPLGSYPFEYRGLERREDGLAITGMVAGLRSSVVIETADLRTAAKFVVPPLAAVGLAAYLRRSA